MTNRNTKRALLSSVMALFLCFAMLLGTTFAWFTDSVESGTNSIVAGNLDVELKYATVEDGTITGWNEVKNQVLFDPRALWEPGRVEVVYLEVSNLGTLALKYQLGVNITGKTIGKSVLGNDIDLTNYLNFKVVPLTDKPTVAYTREEAVAALGETRGFSDYNGVTTPLDAKGGNNDTDYVALVVYMPTTVGNEANYKTGTTPPSIEFGVKLYATQQGAEEDSFGPDYDDGANHENFKVTTGLDLQNAVNEANPGDTITIENDIVLTEGLVIPAAATGFAMRSTPKPVVIDLNGKTLTITAAYDSANDTASSAIVNNGSVILTGKGTIKATNNYTVRNYGTMVIDGVTIENGVMNFADLTVESGNISNSRTGKHTIYGNNATLTINGGTFFNGNPGNATIFSYAGEVVINGGEFSIADGKETLGWTSCLLDAQGNAKFTINGGTVNGEIRDYKNNTTVYGGVFTHTSVNNFLADGFKAVKNGDAYYVVSDTVDNVIVTPAQLAALGGTKINGTYYLAADLDMAGVAMKSMEVSGGATVTFIGNGHKISNLTLGAALIHGMTGAGNEVAGLFDLTAPATTVSLTVSDLAFENVTVACNGGYAAVVVGYNSNAGTTITLNNVDVKGATVTSDSVAALVGYTTGVTTLTDCDVSDLSLTCMENRPEKVGAFVGTANTATCVVNVENCTNTTSYSDAGRVINGAIWNGVMGVNSLTKLENALKSVVDGTVIVFRSDITGYVTAPQAPGVKYTIDGNGKTFVGAITVDGKSQAYPTAGLTIKNVNFVADSITTEACINLGVKGNTNTRYINNLTVENCTFDVPGAVAIKSHDNGDKNLTVIGCTVSARAHSLVQVNNVGDNGLLVENCKVYSKNGVNIGQSEKVTVKDCEFDVKGYAVRFGANGSANGVAETYVIENCQLKSQCAESDDAVVVLRVTADKATLTITNSTLVGPTEILNNSNADVVNN